MKENPSSKKQEQPAVPPNDSSRESGPTTYTTRELTQASYLLACGFQPKVFGIDPRTACFEFTSMPGLLEAVNEFNVGRGSVNIQDFQEARVSLRREIARVLGDQDNGRWR